MEDESNIPILTDLIEKKIDIKLPELGLDADHDLLIDHGLLIDEEDETEFLFDSVVPESEPEPVTVRTSTAATGISRHPELEQNIRRILDEHMEQAWQEIRQAIEASLDDRDDDS